MSRGFNKFLLNIDIMYYNKIRVGHFDKIHNKSLKLNGLKTLLNILKLFNKRYKINKLGNDRYKLLKYSKYFSKWIVKKSRKDDNYILHNRIKNHLKKKLMKSFFIIIYIKIKIKNNRFDLLKFILIYQKQRKALIYWFYFVSNRKFLKQVIYNK
jgi:hypothetical protein